MSRIVASALLLVSTLSVQAKGKKKIILPPDVLAAKTVLVVIDPDAGTSPDAPLANQTARQDVERALTDWGRFTLTTELSAADLVISVRKGNPKFAEPTVGGLPANNRPMVIQPGDASTRVGAPHGPPPMAGDQAGSPYSATNPHPEVEVGETRDTFLVFRGKRPDALDAPPVWRYQAKDALRSPTVPAVDEFRKAIAEAQKQIP